MIAPAPCPHCDVNGFAFTHPLEETEHFRVICDVHPIVEGHILIIPKAHVSCIATCNPAAFAEFRTLYDRAGAFVQSAYGSVATFEHGAIAQTVFHSHVHLLPFQGEPLAIVPEGAKHLTPVHSIDDVLPLFERERKYLFFSIGKQSWTVDTALSTPRFFRDRFAAALGHPERGNWKTMREDRSLMQTAAGEIGRLERAWRGG